MAASLRRLVLLVVALGVAAVLLVGATAALAPAASAQASPVLQRDQAGVRRTAEEPASNRSRSSPVVLLVLGGLVLLAALPPTYRVKVHYHRPSGSSW
jgi:hypothetical protein